jgi:hypothetical protein
MAIVLCMTRLPEERQGEKCTNRYLPIPRFNHFQVAHTTGVGMVLTLVKCDTCCLLTGDVSVEPLLPDGQGGNSI